MKEDEGDGEIKEVRGNAHFMHGWNETNTLEPCDVCKE